MWKHLDDLIARYPVLKPCRETIAAAVQALISAYQRGGKLLLCGNGGSAADCEHIAGELMKSFVLPRPLKEADKQALRALTGEERMGELLQEGLPAVSLCGHPALTTAFANDVDPALGYAQQVWALGRAGDILLGISTSGNAENVCAAAVAARAKGMCVLGLTGDSGGRLAGLCDICVKAPAGETYKIQELHLPVYHAMCLILEEVFFKAASCENNGQ